MTTEPPCQPAAGLLGRALAADTRAQTSNPASYPRRHSEWNVWIRRQSLATALAGALGVPIDTVTVGDDPDRGYGITPTYPGDLITVTEPGSGQTWRFMPDLLGAHSWLLLGACPRCPATAVPLARITGLADLGAWHRTQPATQIPADLADDRNHHPACPLTPHHT